MSVTFVFLFYCINNIFDERAIERAKLRMDQVTLEVKGETQLVNLAEKLRENNISYKLWIEQPENFPTCLATKPYPKSEVAQHFKKLKLCK